MSIFLLHNWDIMNYEIWCNLEESKNAIDDLYPVLLNTYIDKLRNYFFIEDERTLDEIADYKKIYYDLLSASNDIYQAKEEFYKAPTPPTEDDAIAIVEGYYDYLKEYNDKLAEEYLTSLQKFLTKYNIRYHIYPPCKLSLTLEGLLWTQLNYIKYLAGISGSTSRRECIKILELHLNKIGSPYEENYCINDSIKLIEHFLYDKTDQDTLDRALDLSDTLFPSESAKESLRQYYDFANDYPNIRHIGKDKTAKRNLNKSDGILAISLAIAYSAFIIQNHDAILYGKYVKLQERENDLFALFH